MKRFNEKAFVNHLEEWVSRVDDGDLNRAWEIVMGCMKVHARLDREPKQSAAAAAREAWLDWVLAFEGEPATYTMIGMLHEFEQMCPEELRETEFLAIFEEAASLGRGKKLEALRAMAVSEAAKPQGKPSSRAPFLTVIEGGRGEA
jgi:hypothetical protein